MFNTDICANVPLDNFKQDIQDMYNIYTVNIVCLFYVGICANALLHNFKQDINDTENIHTLNIFAWLFYIDTCASALLGNLNKFKVNNTSDMHKIFTLLIPKYLHC